MDERRTFNRRQFERFALPAMYTAVQATRPSQPADEPLTGHAYDISEGGARIELDEPLPEGEPLRVNFNLPGQTSAIAANASVVWVNPEEDDPGPRRMALRFTDFVSSADHARLVRFLGSGVTRLAA